MGTVISKVVLSSLCGRPSSDKKSFSIPRIEPGICGWRPQILPLDDMGVKNHGPRECCGVNRLLQTKW